MTSTPSKLENTALLRQSPIWSRTIVWGIVGFTAFTVVWAAVFKIEEAIPAAGKLEPQASVSEVKTPVGGVVQTVNVKNGQKVKQGDVLVRFETTVSKAQIESLQQVRNALAQEIAFYRSRLAGAPNTVSPEMRSLAKSREAIAAENELYRSQLLGEGSTASLSPEQRLRLQARQAELSSRLASAQLEAGQAQRQLLQTQSQLANTRDKLTINQKILNDMRPLMEEGGIARVQFLRQQQEVLDRQAQLEQLLQEQQRLTLEIAKAGEQFRNAAALTQEDTLSKIANNDKTLAEIDTQATRIVLDNQKRIAEIDSQLSQAMQTFQYQELRAPVDGTVFDLQPSGPGYVANTTEPILKIVPDDTLIAEVFITNKDIGFVREGMQADIRIDSFPFHEFGDIKGELIWIGSDALPPDQIRQFYHFPAKIRLDRQTLRAGERDLPLQSGMSVSTNIKLRKRPILSIFTDMFTKQVESIQFLR